MSEVDKLYIVALEQELEEKKAQIKMGANLCIAYDGAYNRAKEIENKLEKLGITLYD